ncbi:helix-turn-helix domain-containing protein [Marinoscillum sp. MHG1-6]|uniref:helix-turn-helix domain-containing protein n=1 Tax=Marinoscillum sp. MHG1-6 TaxID=2959627 RepID=UPI002157A98A|nr:helix-turn-helix domain-containing protein [Marinoscillum sp. MHG1-6]
MSTPDQLISQLNEQVEANLQNEQFGVDELAQSVDMSRSTLHRKLHELTGQSISQFIREYRLERSLDLLQNENLTASEVAHRVGFGSATYFSKSFHEFFGFTPGEAKDGKIPERKHSTSANKRKTPLLGIGVLIIVVITAGYFAFSDSTSKPVQELEKSIAILPFRNDSHDSSNVYIVNGLMESILNNLALIEDLRVISRTSVEKYRNQMNSKIITEIGKELNVSYIVEGSGQKYGNEMLLTVQLIEVPTERHLWSKQYKRQANNIIDLQIEVAKSIAREIEAIVTEDEQELLEKLPTTNEQAYDYYLKGNEIVFAYERWTAQYDTIELKKAREYFRKAIEVDNTYALAYAKLSLTCYHLNWATNDRYAHEMKSASEMAMLYDPELAESLIAKSHSLHFEFVRDTIRTRDSVHLELMYGYIEKATKVGPDNILALRIARDISSWDRPNLKYQLEFALRSLKLEIDKDTSELINDYFGLPRSFRVAGFFDRAQEAISIMEELTAEGHVARVIEQTELIADKRSDYKECASILQEAVSERPNNRELNRFLAQAYFFMERYDDAYEYYQKIEYDIEVYLAYGDYNRIAFICEKLGFIDKSKKYYALGMERYEGLPEAYKYFNQTELYSALNDKEKAIKSLEAALNQEFIPYWNIRFIKDSPIYGEMRKNPEFIKLLERMEEKFWKKHDEIEKDLMEKSLL